MKILITGSSGFIGTHLVDLLLGAGHKVTGLDIKLPVLLNPNLNFEQCDIIDNDLLTTLVLQVNPEAVIHQQYTDEKAVMAYERVFSGE